MNDKASKITLPKGIKGGTGEVATTTETLRSLCKQQGIKTQEIELDTQISTKPIFGPDGGLKG